LVDEAGKVLESRRAATVIDDLRRFVLTLTELIRSFQNSFQIEAVGIGVPGLHSRKTGAIETSPNIPSLQDVNLEKLVADQVHLPVVSENDANAGAYGEAQCGAGAGCRHMVFLTLGTGLGSGLVLNGKLYTGTSGYGGELDTRSSILGAASAPVDGAGASRQSSRPPALSRQRWKK
jgi:glucokinase